MSTSGERMPNRRRLGLLVRATRDADRPLLVLIVVTLVLSAVAGAMQSLGLKVVVNAVFEHHFGAALAAAGLAAFGAGLLGSAGRAMSDAEHVVSNRVGLAVDRNTLALASEVPGIAHLESPEYLDQLALVRGSGPQLMRAVFTLTRTASLAISMASALVLLGSVHLWLLTLPLFAIPTALLVSRSERPVSAAKARAAERQRASSQLHRLFVTPGPAMELRVFDASAQLDERSDRLWREVTRIQLGGALRGAVVASIGWLSLTAGYVAALWFVARLALRGDASIGDVVMVSQLALVLRGNIAETAEAVRQAASALHVTDRFLWLEDLHDAELAAAGTEPAPNAIRRAVEFDHVSFAYSDGGTPALHDVTIALPAGATVAIVGDNGAGKTTLVKLLTGLYRPTSGTLRVDDLDLTRIAPTAWRDLLTGAFQDFVRLEATARVSVGVGEPAMLDDTERVLDAVRRGDADRIVAALPDGVEAHIGKTYADGAELSGGQWQRVAIARSMMRTAPLVIVIDEPTSALDPEAEQRLFETFAARGAALRAFGTITVLVSHRFSTVRSADLIVVMDRGRVVESGRHADLMASEGTYATMYRRQAEAYR